MASYVLMGIHKIMIFPGKKPLYSLLVAFVVNIRVVWPLEIGNFHENYRVC